MNTIWVVIAIGVVGAVAALIGSWKGRGRRSDLGEVSDQWIAEHRLGQGQDLRR